ncbi:MAG TPA: flagellar hook-associated protein FlgK [Holophagaceae bacterium]|nr:flagellar hook-associated protein FlgK [Holophagaceae bacterium]
MPGLTSSIYVGLSGLQAHQGALNVIGHNIANVNTPGYARQRVELGTQDTQYFGGFGYGPGVSISAIAGIRDRFLELQTYTEQAKQSGAQGRYEGVQSISAPLADEGSTGLGAQLQKFLQGFQDLAARPEDLSLRQNQVGLAQNFITTLQARYRQLDDARTRADNSVGSAVEQINALTTQIAALNGRIAGEPTPGTDSDARDQRKVLTDKLSNLVGIHVFEGTHGEYEISLDSGAATLVNDNAHYDLSVTRDPANNNFYRVDANMAGTVVDVTRRIGEGELGANLDLRDNILSGYQQQLDELAAGVASAVNVGLPGPPATPGHRAGFALNGVTTGNDFFQAGAANGANGLPVGITAAGNYKGMVFALSVNAAISANPNLIAAAGAAGAPGDNTVAQALGNLQSAGNSVDTNGDGVGDSGPYSQFIGQLVNKVGTQGQGYQVTSDSQLNLVTALQNQRDRVSGVDLDEEATQMLNFQRGYQASARFISVINQLSDQLINDFGR